MGNLMTQVRADGEVKSLAAMREVIRKSSSMKTFKPGNPGPWDCAAELIWIAPGRNRDPKIPATHEFNGEIAPILSSLTPELPQSSPDWGRQRVADFHTKRKALSPPPAQKGRLLPQQVLMTLAEFTPAECLVTTDVGSHKILASLEWPAAVPNRFLVSNGLSCMGYGLAAAHAASLVTPETQVICLIGDTGLNMSAGGLAPIAQAGHQVLVVVFNDGALDLIRSHQIRGGATPHGTVFHGPDVMKLANAYGMDSYRACEPQELKEAVQKAVQSGAPTLIDAWIDPVGYPTTPSRSSAAE